MHTKPIPQTDDLDTELPQLTTPYTHPPGHHHRTSPTRPIPLLGLLATIPWMTLFGEASLWMASTVFFIAVIRLIYVGFSLNPWWGMLNLAGFYFPILWVAFGVLNWRQAKREVAFASVAAGCIFYLARHQDMPLPLA